MLTRRSLLGAGPALLALPTPSQTRRTGRLVIVGGAEDRLHDKQILRRFVELCGGPGSRIRVLSAASADPAGAGARGRAAGSGSGVKPSIGS